MQRKELIKTWAALTVLYCVLVVAWGYAFAQSDNIQIFPYLLYTHDHSLYPSDYFIRSAAESFPNERSFFVLFLTPFRSFLPVAAFILQYIFSIALLYGILKIARLFFQNELHAWMVLLILFIPLYYHNLGGNELYYNEFTSENAANTFAAWGIYAWLQNRYLRFYLLVAAATLMHPLGGLQAFLIVSACIFLHGLVKKNLLTEIKRMLPGILIYLLTGGVFIFLVERRFNDIAMDPAELFRTFFVFRNAHHYIPSDFPHSDRVLLGIAYLVTPFVLFKKNRQLFYYSIIVITGCIFYTIGVEKFHNPSIAAAQWFKSTIWLEFLAVCSFVYLLTRIFSFIKPIYIFSLIAAGCIVWITEIFPGIPLIKNGIEYEFPVARKITPEEDISTKAKNLTPKDALFVQPCSFGFLKYYGERSSFIDYKALTHRKSFIRGWNERFQEVYHIDPLTSEKISYAAEAQADDNFRHLTTDDLLRLKNQDGITDIITWKECAYPFPVVAENDVYRIYEITP